jgi:hypothetical protein
MAALLLANEIEERNAAEWDGVIVGTSVVGSNDDEEERKDSRARLLLEEPAASGTILLLLRLALNLFILGTG